MSRALSGTLILAGLAGGLAIGLFFLKHEVKERENLLRKINHQIEKTEQTIHVLNAEWSYRNDPAQLRALSEKFLNMRVVTADQITTLDAFAKGGSTAVAASTGGRP